MWADGWVVGQWWWVLKMILVFKQSNQYWKLSNHRMIYIYIGLTQEPFDTNDDGQTEGQSEI